MERLRGAWWCFIFSILTLGSLVGCQYHPVNPVAFVTPAGGSFIVAVANSTALAGLSPTCRTAFNNTQSAWLAYYTATTNLECSWQVLRTMIYGYNSQGQLLYGNKPGIATYIPYTNDVNNAVPFSDEAISHVFTPNGYTLGYDFDIIPWDWRLDPLSLEQRGWYKALKERIETLAQRTQKPVSLLSFSAGVTSSYYFLTNYINESLGSQGDAWKKEFIANFISIEGALGTEKSILYMALNFVGISFANASVLYKGKDTTFTDAINSWTSGKSFTPVSNTGDPTSWILYTSPWMSQIASPLTEIWGNTTLLYFQNQSYPASREGLLQFIADWKTANGSTENINLIPYLEAISNSWQIGAPGVPMYCFGSTGLPTPVLGHLSPKGPVFMEMEDTGDGVLSIQAQLGICNYLRSNGVPNVWSLEFHNITHTTAFYHENYINAYMKIINGCFSV